MLRDMTQADLPLILSWRNRDDVRQNMYTHHLISEDEHRAWWMRESVNPRTRLLIFELEEQPAGVVIFTQYTGAGGTASWAFYSGDTSRRGIGPLMERAALAYAFDVLQLRKLECEVLAFNSRVIGFHRKHGFAIEGMFRQAYERDGEFHDIYRLAMLAETWRKHVCQAADTGMAGKVFRKPVVFTAEAIQTFAAATGDVNPIHLNKSAALQAGFDDCIAHGLLSAGFISAVFANDFPGPGTVYLSQSLTFKKPVLQGMEGEVVLTVIAHAGRRLEVETQVLIDGEPAVTGEAVLLMSRRNEVYE